MAKYNVLAGPEAYFCPSAARMGVVLPEPDEGHIEGRIVMEEEAMEVMEGTVNKVSVEAGGMEVMVLEGGREVQGVMDPQEMG